MFIISIAYNIPVSTKIIFAAINKREITGGVKAKKLLLYRLHCRRWFADDIIGNADHARHFCDQATG